MTGMNEFIEMFGGLTVANIVTIVLAGVFLRFVYIKIKDYFENRVKAEQEEKDKLNTCLESIAQYPKYRQQSVDAQRNLQGQIDELKATQKEVKDNIKELRDTIEKRERNKTRDRLLQSYRYYTDPEKNPSQSWNTMESDAFWQLFKDYEDLGGDGYMHTVVQPAMNKLDVVDVYSE